MESTESFSDKENNDNQNLSKDESSDKSDKAQKLEKEIKNLREIVKELQQKLKTVRLNNMKQRTTLNIKNTDGDTNKEVTSKHMNYELYRYSGLYCARSTETQYVIGFNLLRECQKDNLYAIEFVKRDNRLRIGKWVMPMSIDIKQLLLEVPLKTKENIIPFAKNCKQHVDCYMIRLQQYKKLKSFLENLNNCNAQTNLGYTLFVLELSHVYDNINQSYARITIYLCYNSKSGRPNEIKFEVNGDVSYEKETEKELKKSLKVFYIHDLITSFNNILNEDDKQFTWKREKKGNDIFEINESINSEKDPYMLSFETSSDEISNKKRKRIISLKKIAKKIKKDNIDEKLKKPGKSKRILKQLPQQVQTEANKPKEIAHSSESSKIVINKSKSESSKILIQLRDKSKNISKIKPLPYKLRNRKKTTTTSTPKHVRKSSFKELPALDISDIVNKENNE